MYHSDYFLHWCDFSFLVCSVAGSFRHTKLSLSHEKSPALLMSCSDLKTGFVMDNHLNRHTYGFIQSRLVPFYLHLGSACAFFNLTIYAVYHPRDMLNEREAFQVRGFVRSTSSDSVKTHNRLILSSGYLLSQPDLYLLCVSDSCGCQRPVVWSNGVGDHGRHASHRAGVRTGPGHRPVIEPRSLC